jgi:hypothetical protein
MPPRGDRSARARLVGVEPQAMPDARNGPRLALLPRLAAGTPVPVARADVAIVLTEHESCIWRRCSFGGAPPR